MDIIEQSILGILPFLYHLGAGLLLLAAFIFIYVKITPYPEMDLIRSGNVAAACSLAGATLGFAIPLAQATAQSGNIMDMLLWSLIALIVQVLVYLVVRLMIPNLARDIQDWISTSMPEWKTRYVGVENLNVAVMGCIVNGPGESKHADIGISLPGTGETPTAPVFIDGQKAATLRGPTIAAEFKTMVAEYIEKRFGFRV